MTPEQFAEAMSQMRATQQQQLGLSQPASVQGPSTSGGAGNIMYMPAGYLQPPSLNDATNYDVWFKRFTIWEKECGLDKSRITSTLRRSIGNKCPIKTGLADKVHQKYSAEELSGPAAYDLIVNFLKKELAGNEIQKALTNWTELEQCSREDNERVEDFLDRFDTIYVRMANSNPGLVMPSEIKAFILIERSKVTGLEKKMVQSRLNFSDKSTMYEQTERALKEVLGAGPGVSNKKDQDVVTGVKGDEDCLLFNGKKSN